MRSDMRTFRRLLLDKEPFDEACPTKADLGLVQLGVLPQEILEDATRHPVATMFRPIRERVLRADLSPTPAR